MVWLCEKVLQFEANVKFYLRFRLLSTLPIAGNNPQEAKRQPVKRRCRVCLWLLVLIYNAAVATFTLVV